MLNDILGLLSTAPKEIMDAAESELKRIGYQTIRGGDDLFLFAIPPQFFGDEPKPAIVPLLCAHVDVVGEIPPKRVDLILDVSGNKISLSEKSKAHVLGADDRAGIYAMFKIVSSLSSQLPFVVLTDKEEVGGIGAKAVVDSGLLDVYATYISCYIELDRKGNGEFVSYDQSGSPNKALGEMFIDQGFKLGHGSYSDVSDFTFRTGVSNVNLSVGYRHEHTTKEILFLDELDLTVSRVLRMWKNYPQLFSEVFEQEEYKGYDYNNDDWGWDLQPPLAEYDRVLEQIYVTVVDKVRDDHDIPNLVRNFIDELPADLMTELVVYLDEIVDELCVNDVEVQIAEELMSTITPPSGGWGEVEEDEDDDDFGLYVDARGAVVCGAKNRVGCY